MYFFYDSEKTDGSYEKCAYLPPTFDRDHLKLDIMFTFKGKHYVQHQALVTSEQCTSAYINEIKDYVYGYMSPDEQYCVPECTGIYAPGDEKSRTCSCASHLAPNGRSCAAECDFD